MYLVGQNKNKKLIEEGKLDNANFIIIKGPRGYGKTYLSKFIADHYQMNYILLDNKVNTIRDLVSVSDMENNCLYHFKDFDKSSPAAKAALLKIAEETPKGVKIIVTTSSYNFLETLMSRAYVMNIEAYSAEEIEDYNDKIMLNEELLSKLIYQLNVTITPTILFNYKQREDIEELVDMAISAGAKISTGLLLEDISDISNKFWKDDIDRLHIFLDLLKTAINKETKNYYKIISSIEKTLYTLNKVAISNYKQLIHNMLMEMI